MSKMKEELSQEELQSVIISFVNYRKLMSIPTSQRFVEVLPHYFNNYSMDELARKWDVPKQRLYTMKNQMKNYLKKNNKNYSIEINNTVNSESIKTESYNTIESVKTNTENLFDLENVAVSPQESNDVEIFDMLDKFYFTVNQTSSNASIIKKLQMLISLLEDEEGEYDIYLTVKQK